MPHGGGFLSPAAFGDSAPPFFVPKSGQRQGAVNGKLKNTQSVKGIGSPIKIPFQPVEGFGRYKNGFPESALDLFKSVLAKEIRKLFCPPFGTGVQGYRNKHTIRIQKKALFVNGARESAGWRHLLFHQG
jgi:hypothetical protein